MDKDQPDFKQLLHGLVVALEAETEHGILTQHGIVDGAWYQSCVVGCVSRTFSAPPPQRVLQYADHKPDCPYRLALEAAETQEDRDAYYTELDDMDMADSLQSED